MNNNHFSRKERQLKNHILKLENYRGRRMAHVQLGPDYGNQEAVMLGLSDSSAVFNAITKAKRLFREKSS